MWAWMEYVYISEIPKEIGCVDPNVFKLYILLLYFSFCVFVWFCSATIWLKFEFKVTHMCALLVHVINNWCSLVHWMKRVRDTLFIQAKRWIDNDITYDVTFYLFLMVIKTSICITKWACQIVFAFCSLFHPWAICIFFSFTFFHIVIQFPKKRARIAHYSPNTSCWY